jgi:hypothetical protein
VFLLSDIKEGGEEIMWHGHMNLSERERKRAERRSGKRCKCLLNGSGRGSKVILVVVFNTSPVSTDAGKEGKVDT